MCGGSIHSYYNNRSHHLRSFLETDLRAPPPLEDLHSRGLRRKPWSCRVWELQDLVSPAYAVDFKILNQQLATNRKYNQVKKFKNVFLNLCSPPGHSLSFYFWSHKSVACKVVETCFCHRISQQTNQQSIDLLSFFSCLHSRHVRVIKYNLNSGWEGRWWQNMRRNKSPQHSACSRP